MMDDEREGELMEEVFRVLFYNLMGLNLFAILASVFSISLLNMYLHLHWYIIQSKSKHKSKNFCVAYSVDRLVGRETNERPDVDAEYTHKYSRKLYFIRWEMSTKLRQKYKNISLIDVLIKSAFFRRVEKLTRLGT